MTTVVSINNTPLTTKTLDGVSIRYGRDNIDSYVNASTCTIQLVSIDTTPPTINLRDRVDVEVDGTVVFYGKVTDRTMDVDYIKTGRLGTITTIIATGSLSELGRIFSGASTYPSELDGARASRILTEAAPTSPSIESVTSSIDSYNFTYDYWSSAGIETIDPGTATLLSRSANITTAYDILTSEVSTSAGAPGLYETPDGRYGYQDAFRRSKPATPITIPANVVDAQLSLGSAVNELINSVTISYGSASPQATTSRTNAGSIGAYGTIARSITSQLSLLADADSVANRLVTSRATPRTNLQSITVDLSHPDLSPTTRTALLAPTFGRLIQITGLDTRLGLGSSWLGFIEGWSARITKDRHFLTLVVSARLYSLQLATVDKLSSAINRLEGAVNGLAELWAPDPPIDQVSNTLDSQTTVSIDRAYKIGA